jgi:hypothetical protein
LLLRQSFFEINSRPLWGKFRSLISVGSDVEQNLIPVIAFRIASLRWKWRANPASRSQMDNNWRSFNQAKNRKGTLKQTECH